jgi:HSP20 family protein
MRIVRWQPLDLTWQAFERMEALRRQLDQMFDEFKGASSEREAAWYPAIELMDAGDNLVLRAQLPGIDRNHLNIQVTQDAILIEGDYPQPQQSESQQWLHSEFAYGRFRRLISLPASIENDRVHADFHNGILTLTLPKTEQERRRVVKVNLGEFANSASTTTLEAASETIPNGGNHGS